MCVCVCVCVCVQVGRVVAGPAEFYSARIPRQQQKRSLVEELFADEELRRFVRDGGGAGSVLKLVSNEGCILHCLHV